MFFSIGYDAGYKCVLCNKFYKFDDIDKSNWKCVICGEYIRIAIKSTIDNDYLVKSIKEYYNKK